MPEAIATTKRRFYKALESLSSTTQQPSSQTSSTTSAKRSSAAAFDEARERVRKRLRHSTSSNSLSTSGINASVVSLPRKSIPTDHNGPPPNFSPWSQDAFLGRLKTFSNVSLWHPKPDAINEVEWAKRGWVCVDVNTVACKGGCEKRVVVSIDTAKTAVSTEEEADNEGADEATAALEDAMVARYRSAIVDGHSESCLWHKAGCKDDIYRLPVVRPSIWQAELRERFQSLAMIKDSILNVKTRGLENTTEKLLQGLPKEILLLSESPNADSEKQFEIAMHGWRGSSESGNQLLHCDACFQRVGLWMYQPQYRRSRLNTADEGDEEEDSALIDLVEMHRDHCPWRNSATQQATGSLGGLNACQILHRVVTMAARDHRRRSEQLSTEQEEAGDDDNTLPTKPTVSREETARQDKERESRLRKLKSLFNIKRRSTIKAPVQKAS